MTKNIKDGYHLNSNYWQTKKKQIPNLTERLTSISVGMILGDASIYKKSSEAFIKFEQGYKQEEFITHIFFLFKEYTFMEKLGQRINKKNNTVKSYWFKTFSHESFTKIRELFYTNNKKTVYSGIVKVNLNEEGLAFWIMCDGSRNGNIIILHTQGFTKAECKILSDELNEKFQLESYII